MNVGLLASTVCFPGVPVPWETRDSVWPCGSIIYPQELANTQSTWLQCEELLCLHTPAGLSRAEVGTLSCQPLLQSFSRNIQESHGSQGREMRNCLEHINTESGPVPGRSLGTIPSCLRKSKSSQRMAALSPPIWLFHIWLLGFREEPCAPLR